MSTIKKKSKVNKGSDETVSQSLDGALDIRRVPVADIATNEYNPNDMSSRVFDLLVEQIKLHGMPQPILVKEDGDSFIVIDGEHRLRASTQAGLESVAVVVVDASLDDAKFKTIAMNELRGEYIPLKMAKLLADLADIYDDKHIARMTGLTEDSMISLTDLLEVPDVGFDAEATITTMDVSRPIPVTLMLMPDEFGEYEEAMIKAMNLMGDKVTPLMGEEVNNYDNAMSTALGLLGVKLRNVGLSTICKVFNAIPKEELAKVITKVVKDKS